jgi:rod shape-determining protein MreD
MRWIRFAVLLLVFTLLQAGLVQRLAVGASNITPDLILVVLVFIAIFGKTREAIIASFAAGFAADLVGHMMGVYTLSYGILGTALAYLHKVIAIRKMPWQAVTIFLFGFISGTLAYWLNLLRTQSPVSNIYQTICFSSIYSGLIGPFLFLICAWWMRIKTNRFHRD